ncbi:MAG: MBL fold metallo-hydrolase, partial [Candidatus Dormibacteraeota bacterium]|nr:MBL fold metallo-hydrolase [Candidatus Dormibacteraeota bacterium]
METRVDQIADRIYRLSTCIPDAAPGGFTFNQFLVDAEEPLLYHTGMRQLFPLVRAAVERVMPIERLRWIAFAHVEADECGSVNEFLAAAPHAQVAHGALGCMVSVNDMCDRPPRPLADGDVLELGGAALQRRVLEVATPHVPHNWESHVLFERETGTLFCGDLCTQLGDGAALTDKDIL